MAELLPAFLGPLRGEAVTRDARWVEWRSIVEEFLAAMDAMRVCADVEPMFTFVTETLGEPRDTERWMRTGEDHMQQRKGEYGEAHLLQRCQGIVQGDVRPSDHQKRQCRLFR